MTPNNQAKNQLKGKEPALDTPQTNPDDKADTMETEPLEEKTL
jgi:hypothetical protein